MSSIDEIIYKFESKLDDTDYRALKLYFEVYEKNSQKFLDKITNVYLNDPTLRKFLDQQSEEERKANHLYTNQLLKNAIYEKRWGEYLMYNFEVGKMYASLGLSFIEWFNLVSELKTFIRPKLHETYTDYVNLFLGLTGMNLALDSVMSVIGESYLFEKIQIIEKERSELKKYYRFFNSSHDFACISNSEGYLEEINETFISALGYTEEELTSVPFWNFIHPDDVKPTEQEITMLDQGKESFQFQNRYRKANGEYIYLEWNSIKDKDSGKFFANARDVTELVLKRKELSELNKNLENKVVERTSQLQEVNNELESFTYSVSHDLRAPLRSIIGFSDILLEDYGGVLDDGGKRYLNSIIRNTSSIANLIDDLLEFSRLGKKEVLLAKVDMNLLCKRVVTEFETNENTNVKIAIDKIDNAVGDENLLFQAWYNLVSNAVKYSSKIPNPKIRIYSESDQRFVTYHIEDNGAGFDMRFYNKLFGVFQRLHSQEEFPGTGVGLALVHRIVKRHEGEIWAHSLPNKKTIFSFKLKKH